MVAAGWKILKHIVFTRQRRQLQREPAKPQLLMDAKANSQDRTDLSFAAAVALDRVGLCGPPLYPT
jgi:hypothetical protein